MVEGRSVNVKNTHTYIITHIQRIAVVVFFTSTDRASIIPSNNTWGELENAGRHGPGGEESGRTAWKMIFDYLASRGTGAPPYLTLGYGTAQYTKGAVGLWPRG